MKKSEDVMDNDMTKREKGWNIAVAFFVTAILFVMLIIFFDIMYCLNDDLMIQSILSGRYSGSPNGKSVYLSMPLSILLSGCYALFPRIPWLGVFFAGCYAACFFFVLSAALEGAEKTIEKAANCILSVLVFIGFFLNGYLMMHYTVVAAVVGGTAVYLFLISPEGKTCKETLRRTLLPIVLLLLCYLIRTKVLFMVLPFLAAGVLCRMVREKSIVKYLAPLGCLCAGLLALMLFSRLYYGNAAWQDYLDYNDARTELYDYAGIWEDEQAASYYAGQGYSAEEMAIYLDYNVLLNENLTADDYRTISAYAGLRPEGQRGMTQRLKDGIWLYRYKMVGSAEDFPYNAINIVLYVIWLFLLMASRDGKSVWMIVLLFAARSVLWLYLLMGGRYPERVVVSLYLIEAMTLLAMIRNAAKLLMARARISKTDGDAALPGKKLYLTMQRFGVGITGIVIGILALEMGYQLLPDAMEAQKEQLMINTEEDKVYDYIKLHPENLYLMDVYASVYRTEYAVKGYDPSYENYMLLGGWISGSPLAEEKLSRWGYASAFDALEYGENVYLVLKQGVGMTVSELERYYAWKTGQRAEFKLTDEIATQRGIFEIYHKGQETDHDQ